jgi:hypothetical protein
MFVQSVFKALCDVMFIESFFYRATFKCIVLVVANELAIWHNVATFLEDSLVTKLSF